jgi:hypothetical protein
LALECREAARRGDVERIIEILDELEVLVIDFEWACTLEQRRTKKCAASGEGTLSNFQNYKSPPTGGPHMKLGEKARWQCCLSPKLI